MIREAVYTTAQNFVQRGGTMSDVIGESSTHYTGKGNPAQRLNIQLGKLGIPREAKLEFVGWIVGRPVQTTKELMVGEALAISQCQKLEELYDEWQQSILESI